MDVKGGVAGPEGDWSRGRIKDVEGDMDGSKG